MTNLQSAMLWLKTHAAMDSAEARTIIAHVADLETRTVASAEIEEGVLYGTEEAILGLGRTLEAGAELARRLKRPNPSGVDPSTHPSHSQETQMLGRSIPASTVQDHLKKIVNAVQGDAPLGPTEIAAINAGEDMGLLTIDTKNASGTPTGITWTRL